MSFLSGIPILGDIIKGIVGHQQRKQEMKAAEQEGKLRILDKASDNLSEWEQLHAKGSQTSWKDEFWTIIFAIPLILGFVTLGDWFDGPAIVREGFEAFTLMPDWYQYTLVTMVLASFGIRMTDKIKTMIGR